MSIVIDHHDVGRRHDRRRGRGSRIIEVVDPLADLGLTSTILRRTGMTVTIRIVTPQARRKPVQAGRSPHGQFAPRVAGEFSHRHNTAMAPSNEVTNVLSFDQDRTNILFPHMKACRQPLQRHRHNAARCLDTPHNRLPHGDRDRRKSNRRTLSRKRATVRRRAAGLSRYRPGARIGPRQSAPQTADMPRRQPPVGHLGGQFAQSLFPPTDRMRITALHHTLHHPLGRLRTNNTSRDILRQPPARGTNLVRALPARPIAIAQQPPDRPLLYRPAAPLARSLQWPLTHTHSSNRNHPTTTQPTHLRRNVTDVAGPSAMPGGVPAFEGVLLIVGYTYRELRRQSG
ncbi:hypothetical protein [Actinoplanes sp. N902-109]|uniref:hypothetical protein n=1 Tax=Actinoplanes sp. (strain N902-109) TaxID=649831 RepID=UPI0012F8AA3F|nr:hypothetical protein [Actinoplanes sp. N902-109]